MIQIRRGSNRIETSSDIDEVGTGSADATSNVCKGPPGSHVQLPPRLVARNSSRLALGITPEPASVALTPAAV